MAVYSYFYLSFATRIKQEVCTPTATRKVGENDTSTGPFSSGQGVNRPRRLRRRERRNSSFSGGLPGGEGVEQIWDMTDSNLSSLELERMCGDWLSLSS